MKYLALLMFMSSVADAATTGTLSLSGTVGATISISVDSSNGNAAALDLSTTQTTLNIATVTENSNSSSGYTISAKSTNGSSLNHSSLPDNVPYTIKYAGGSAVTLTTSNQTVKTQATGGVYSGVTSAVTIQYTGTTSIAAGTYTDTITFTIAAI